MAIEGMVEGKREIKGKKETSRVMDDIEINGKYFNTKEVAQNEEEWKKYIS